MKITREVLLNLMIEIYSKRFAHEDYYNLHKKQLKVITKFLNIEGLIEFDYDSKKFILKRINKDYILNKTNTPYNNLDQIEGILSNNINDLLLLISQERTIISSGQLTTFKDFETIHELLQTRKSDFAIEVMNGAIIELYRKQILEALNFLFNSKYSDKENISWNINEIIGSREENILNEVVDDF